MLGIIVFWFFNKMISKIEHKPWLKIKESLKIIFSPVLIGTILATIPFIFVIIFLNAVYTGNLFSVDAIFYKYDVTSIT